MNIVAIVQARLGSTRFPGKVMTDLAGKPCINRVIDRLEKSKHINEIVVAIPDRGNERLEDYAKAFATIIKGEEENVLARVAFAAVASEADVIVDITADCPLVDPKQIDYAIGLLIDNSLDYISNVVTRSWPDGFDFQVYTNVMLQETHIIVPDGPHVGWNIKEHKSELSQAIGREVLISNIEATGKNFHPDWRLTLDTREDAELISIIFNHFKDDFTCEEVIDYILENQELLEINSHIRTKTPDEG